MLQVVTLHTVTVAGLLFDNLSEMRIVAIGVRVFQDLCNRQIAVCADQAGNGNERPAIHAVFIRDLLTNRVFGKL